MSAFEMYRVFPVGHQSIVTNADGSLSATELYISPVGLPALRVIATGSSITTLIINLSKVI